MRGLAEYAMSGRRQAVTVAVLFGLIPMLNILSAAIVGLVVLRKGLQEGLLVLLWALLPAGLQWVISDTTPVIMLFGVTALAMLLRSSGSWSKVLVAATVLGLLTQLSLALQVDYVATVEAFFTELLADNQGLASANGTAATPEDLVALLMQFYGAYHILLFVVCLIIARAWQASLYNPGGFRQEFHALRLDPRMVGLLLVLALAGMYGIEPLSDWVALLCMAPMFVGLAIIHCVVALRQWGAGVLVIGYLTLMLMSPAVIALGFADSVFNFRKRAGNQE